MNVSFRRAKATDTVVDLKTFNDMQIWLERVANMTTDQYFQLIKGDPCYMLYSRAKASTTTMSYSDYAFGFTCSAAVVSVNRGYLYHGTRTPITINAADVTINADNTYIYVSYVYGTAVASITSSLTMPQHTATTLNWPLYLATLTSGTASVGEGNIFHLGNIHILGSFA